ncbi:hypothetical protein ACLOJK_006078 [Asimina triloba]
MASDSSSGDIDEDELLQIALKEQAQRDVNYRRPSSTPSKPSKPVVNLVRPPASIANRNSKNPNPVPARPKVDEDSEVELLSISSGDEDSSRPYAGSQNRAGGGGPRKGGRVDAGSGGNRRWDGDEPDCWKHVDEAEVRI